MYKILLILCMLFTSFPTAVSEKYDKYLSLVNEVYDKYTIHMEEKENFTVAVVEGICNGEMTYGVFLSSYKAGAYCIKVFVDEKEYALETDSRGDSVIYAVSMPVKETYVCVFDKEGKNSTKRWSYKIEYMTIEDLENAPLLSNGMNGGTEFSKMSRRYNTKTAVLFISGISVLIIAISIVIIIFLKKNKKGMFDEKNRKSEPIVFTSKDTGEEDPIVFEKSDEYKIDNKDYEIEKEEIKEVYQKKYYFDDDEENFIDIKPLLEKVGFDTNYASLSEEEKNKVMIYFMTLRHEGTISEAQYKKETSRLWKKY